nr:MAG: hypothetical protein [Penaeus semisulcatus pemonivirus]
MKNDQSFVQQYHASNQRMQFRCLHEMVTPVPGRLIRCMVTVTPIHLVICQDATCLADHTTGIHVLSAASLNLIARQVIRQSQPSILMVVEMQHIFNTLQGVSYFDNHRGVQM